jgi:Immunity protein 26
MTKKKIERTVGDVVAIPLGDGTYGYGRLLREPLIAFYKFRTTTVASAEDVMKAAIAFIVFVMNYSVTEGLWPVIGTAPLEADLVAEPLFFKRDPISGKLSIYKDSTAEEVPASRNDCNDLECAAVWEPEHVVDRLVDYFAGRPNKWVESMRP